MNFDDHTNATIYRSLQKVTKIVSWKRQDYRHAVIKVIARLNPIQFCL